MNAEDRIWFLYIARCADGSLYTGIATNVDRRIREHNSLEKGANYCKARRPVTLLARWTCGPDMGTALRIERAVKKLSRKKKGLAAAGLRTVVKTRRGKYALYEGEVLRTVVAGVSTSSCESA